MPTWPPAMQNTSSGFTIIILLGISTSFQGGGFFSGGFSKCTLLEGPKFLPGLPMIWVQMDTVFKMLGPNHKIVIEAFDDPDISGVTCHLSRSKTGGLRGGLGVAEDKADAAIACRQIGQIKLPDNILNQLAQVLFSLK